MFKMNKLGRWGKGEQKGLRSYDTNTYDQERDEMEQMARREAKLNKRSVVTDMNRDIFDLELIAEENNDERIEQEDNLITYMGEDGEPEEYGMDGDENYPWFHKISWFFNETIKFYIDKIPKNYAIKYSANNPPSVEILDMNA